ncbi:hypothetical protein HAX54_036577 [Datura stramonium]|uniref:Uncharacterized protein n=1 Tax=Datura stramonium TaxID=4076 RepID=A0ABS8VIF8_DATST|nr:hypothetical protein [Datura stramonium]
MLSHLYGMQMLQLWMNGMTEEQLKIDYPLSEHSRALCRVRPGYEEPLDDDMAMEDEMARVDSDIDVRRQHLSITSCATRHYTGATSRVKQQQDWRNARCNAVAA